MDLSRCTRRVALVCFDVGGVLVRLRTAWDEACAAAGLPLRPVSRWDELDQIVRRYHAGEVATGEFACELARIADARYTADEVLAIHRGFLGEPYPGAAELVDELHAAGIATALLSNTNADHWRIMREVAAVRRIGVHVLSHEIHALKPAAEAFAAVERATGVAPERIVFFDDSPANVAAARARGWLGFVIAPGAATPPQMRAALASLSAISAGED